MAKKYKFQRNKKKTLTWLIAIAAVIVIAAVGIVIYNGTTSGDIEVTPIADASLNNIAENAGILKTHTDKIMDYYELYYGMEVAEGDPTMLIYMGSEAADMVYIYVKPVEQGMTVETAGMFARPNLFSTDLGQLFSGEISLSDTTVALQSANENCLIYVEDYKAEKIDDSALATIVAELEAIIAEGPVVTEEAPAEEAPAETPAE